MPRQSKSIPAELPQPEVIDHQAILRAYSSGEIDLVVVLGPTASGKTRYAVELARTLSVLSAEWTNGETGRVGGRTVASEVPTSCDGASGSRGALGAAPPIGKAEIISADSRQIYRGMDIGTGKDLAEYGEIPYHLIDIAEPGTQYNVYQFQQDFLRAYGDIRSRGGIPILCGGTGLYINAVTAGYDFQTSRPLSERRDSHEADAMTAGPRRPYFIGTLVSREVRNVRIDARLDARLREGMTEEIRGLLEQGVPAERLISYGLEYKFVTLHVLGELSYDEMRLRLATAIHQFAKRQMTWFRGMERSGAVIHWTEV